MGKKIVVSIIIVSIFLCVLIIRSTTTFLAWPVLKVATRDKNSGYVTYQTLYENRKIKNSEGFESDELTFYYAHTNDFRCEKIDGHLVNTLVRTDIYDEEGKSIEPDDIIKDILQTVAEKTDHSIVDVTVILHEGIYYVQVELNVNLWDPTCFYRYDQDKKKLTLLYTWDNKEVVGITNVEEIKSEAKEDWTLVDEGELVRTEYYDFIDGEYQLVSIEYPNANIKETTKFGESD